MDAIVFNNFLQNDILNFIPVGWFTATRAFGIIGVLTIVASVALVIVCLFVFTKERQKIVYIINIIVTFVGGK